MSLDQTLGDRQAQSHAGGGAIHADKILENFLMVFRGDAAAGIRYGNDHAVGLAQRLPAALLFLRLTRGAALPEVRLGDQGDGPAAGGMLERVIQEIRGGLLDFLIIESECRKDGGELHFHSHLLALECLVPTSGQFGQAVADIVVMQMQNQLSTLERRIIQEHGYQADQPLAAFLGFLKYFTLLFSKFSKRTGKKQIVIALDYRQRSLQLVGGGC